jgi:hypothetical protein
MQGGLNFAPAVTNGSDGYDARSVAVADGKPDLLVANSYVDHVSLYRISGHRAIGYRHGQRLRALFQHHLRSR